MERTPNVSTPRDRTCAYVNMGTWETARTAHGYVPVSTFIYTIICLKSVGVRSLQVAILARSSREMSLTDRILPRYILSRVRVSVRPRIFLYAKKTQAILARMLDPLCGQLNN